MLTRKAFATLFLLGNSHLALGNIVASTMLGCSSDKIASASKLPRSTTDVAVRSDELVSGKDRAGAPTLLLPASSGFVAPELPREYLSTVMPSVTGKSIRVPAGGNLQAAIDAAQLGDELVLDAGATYTGTFTLRKKSGTGWLTIRSSGTLPSEGTRATPSHAPQMARLVAGTGPERVIKTDPGAHHYRLVGLEVTAQPGATIGYTLVALGDASSAQNTLESQPHHLVLDRVYIHGTPSLDFQRCVALNSASTAIIDSWLSECHGKGMDSQAIAGWNGTGPYKIVNNFLEGAGENVLFGGADPEIPNALPADIEIRRNHFYKPPAWKGVWLVKNLLELKIGLRVLIEGNVFENNWVDGQTGFAINLKSVNQSGKAPWSETRDITFRNNIIRNSASAVSLAGQPETHQAISASRMLFDNNVFDRIGTGDYPGGQLFQVTGIDDLTITNNSAVSSHSSLTIYGSPPLQRLTVVRNIFSRTTYGISGSGVGYGTKALEGRAAPGWVFRDNVMAGANAATYPAHNHYPAQTEDIGFTDVAQGLLQLMSSSKYLPLGGTGTLFGVDYSRLPAGSEVTRTFATRLLARTR